MIKHETVDLTNGIAFKNEDSDTNSRVIILDRMVAIFDMLYHSNVPLGVSELASGLDISKASTYRILRSLVTNGILEKTDNDCYQLGVFFVKYGKKVQSGMTLRNIALPFLTQLTKETGETSELSVFVDEQCLCLESVEGDKSMLISSLPSSSPLHCTASGKLFLANSSNDFLKEFFSKGVKKCTVNTIDTYEEFLEEKKHILSEGAAYSREEFEYGLDCFSAPLYDFNGTLIGGLSIAAPSTRIKVKGERKTIDIIKKIAAQLNEKLKDSSLKVI